MRLNCLLVVVVFVGVALGASTAKEIGAAEHRRGWSFPISKDGEPILLPVEIASKRYTFLLDTGCSFSAFDVSLKALLGAPTRKVNLHTGVGQPEVTQLFKAPPIFLGGAALRGISDVTCVDCDAMSFGGDKVFDGIIGMDGLWGARREIVRIDFDRGELSILPSVPKGSGQPVELSSCLRRPCVCLGPIGPNAPPGSDPGYFTLDTGEFGESGTLCASRFRSLVDAGKLVVLGERDFATAQGTRRCRYGRVAEFELAGFSQELQVRDGDGLAQVINKFEPTQFRHQDLIFSEGSLNSLSLDYLSRYVITFDFSEMQVYFSPGKRFAERDGHDLSGMDLIKTNGEIVVRSVEEHSVADLAGVRKGDVIAELDGVSGRLLSWRQAWRRLGTPSAPWLTIRRGKETVRVKLDLREPPVGRRTPVASGPGKKG